MTVKHHPSSESILAYANGSLKIALALVVSAHVEGCAECREALELAENLGGILLDCEPPAELPVGAFANVLEKLEMQAQSPQAPWAHDNKTLPFSLRHQRIGSRRWLAPGIWIRPILKDRETRAYLLGASPGRVLPRHGHRGVEMTQVLEGEFFDGDVRYGPGDFLEAGDDVEHSLVVGADVACVCAIACEGVPKGLSGLLMRLFA